MNSFACQYQVTEFLRKLRHFILCDSISYKIQSQRLNFQVM